MKNFEKWLSPDNRLYQVVRDEPKIELEDSITGEIILPPNDTKGWYKVDGDTKT